MNPLFIRDAILSIVSKRKQLLVVFSLLSSYCLRHKVYWLYCRVRNYYSRYIYPVIRSLLLRYLSSKISVDYRKVFRACNFPSNEQILSHSHPEAASSRSGAVSLCSQFALACGKRMFSVSKSKRDTDGSRLYYTAKDLSQDLSLSTYTKDDLVAMIDVDYYVDIHDYLTGNNLILYTVVPTGVAGIIMNASYNFNSDHELCYNVTGGASYQHRLWDYNSDSFVIDHWWGSSIYLVEYRVSPTNENARVIYFNHVRNVYTCFGWLIQGKRIKRLEVNHGGYNHARFQVENFERKTSVYHSFALLDSVIDVRVPDDCLQTCLTKARNVKDINISDIERICMRFEVPNTAYAATVLYEVLKSYVRIYPTFTMYPDRSYQCLTPLVHERGKPAARQILPALMDGAWHPRRSYNNDVACIQGRVVDVKNPNHKFPPFYYQCLSEFVSLLIPDADKFKCLPLDFDERYEKLKRPTQRALIDKIKDLLFYSGRFFVTAFQKAETYAKITAPRNISTVPQDHNYRLGQFTYPVSDLLKKTDWYVFGHTPAEISQSVFEFCSNKDYVVCTDISKCDGSTGSIHSLLIQNIYLRAYAPEFHDEIIKLTNNEARNSRCFTKHNVVYEAPDTTISGSSQTSIRNTAINAFNNYVVNRVDGLSPSDAYKALGRYGGDDGLSKCNPDTLERVFAKMGMLIKAEVVERHNYLTFLGRIYIDPWATTQHVIDIARHVRKLHLTTTPDLVPIDVVLHNKVAGYMATDPDTPLISDWCHMILRTVSCPPATTFYKHRKWTERDQPYYAQFDCSNNKLYDFDLINSIFIKELNIDQIQYFKLIEDLKSLSRFDEYSKLDGYIHCERVVEIPVELGTELVEVNKKVEHQAKIKDNLKKGLEKKRAKTNKPSDNKEVNNSSVQGKIKATPVCQQFVGTGKCTFGKKCKFTHPTK